MVASNFSSPLHSSQQSRVTKKMSITQTYFLAHKARGKLSHEAARADHNLRLLVGHANLLDSLMLDLAEAERDQEAWFNQSIKSSAPKPAAERHVQWADAIPETAEEEWEADSDSDSDSELDEEEDDVEMADIISLRRVPSNTAAPASPRMQTLDEEEEDDEEDYEALSLTRSPSHSASPPELDHDSDSSEDESMPPSPPFASLPSFSEKQRETLSTVYYTSHPDEEDQKADFYNDGYYLPPRNPARLVSAISVY